MATVATNTNELERKLALLAFQFRKAGADQSRCRNIANQYEAVFNELIQVAGGFAEPHFDSLLPDGYMPKQYELRKLASHSGALQTRSMTRANPFKKLVFRVLTLKPIRDIFVRGE